jgi:ketosteroid isomerase-like protein
MQKRLTAIGILVIVLTGCAGKKENNTTDYRKEIEKTEADFKKYLAEKGVAESFHFFADSAAIIIRGNDSMIKGPDAIKNYYGRPAYKNATVNWSPDGITVSSSGDLAFSYGRYHWVFTDSTGKKTDYKGNYHTIWKKQADGSWKYVWD